jgi:hypothetical protein
MSMSFLTYVQVMSFAICSGSGFGELCDNCDGGRSSDGNEVGVEHELKTVLSLTQMDIAYETAESYF